MAKDAEEERLAAEGHGDLDGLPLSGQGSFAAGRLSSMLGMGPVDVSNINQSTYVRNKFTCWSINMGNLALKFHIVGIIKFLLFHRAHFSF